MGRTSLAIACALATSLAPLVPAGPAVASSAVIAKPDPGTGEVEGSSFVPGSFPNEEAEVLDLTNQERRKAGCQALRAEDTLHSSALEQSRYMAASQNLSHEGPGNSQPDDRMEEAGYDTSQGWGENVAYGQDTPDEVMDSWMKSTPHRKNILNCDFKALGVGVARAIDGNLYWTQNFGGQ
ncbi:hypothetical protein GCM10009682_25810 [Luedemannella flava]|uniref:SCP domain-containing protein n=1 Tax=Luedemannella flava TaxID=349316 RepID=A0ABP4Y7D1_9ACTN